MKKVIAFLLCMILTFSSVPFGMFSAEAVEGGNPEPVVFLDGTAGDDTNDGKTAATAVATLARAIEAANTFSNVDEVTVVVTGVTTLGTSTTYKLPKNNAKIIVTSKFNGIDYAKSGACLKTYNKTVACIYFNGDFVFEHVTIIPTNTNPIFVMQYNNFKIGDGVTVNGKDPAKSTNHPILLVGCNKNIDKAASPSTFSKDLTIEVNSGTWAYIRGGDRDSTSTYDGNMTININGGKFLCPVTTDAGHYTSGNVNGPTGKSSYGKNAKIVMNLRGGEMNSLIGCSYVGETSGHTNEADITINIYDGFKLTNKFAAVQSAHAVFNGKLTINIYGGDLSGLVESKLYNASVDNFGTGTVTVNRNPNDADSQTAFENLTGVCVQGCDTDVRYGDVEIEPYTVVYVKDCGTGDGSSPEKALGTLMDAYNSLDLSKDCTVVICGPYTQKANFDPWIEYEGKVTITSVFEGVDYRETADAEYIVSDGWRFFLYGATELDDINVRLNAKFWLLVAQCNPLYVGEGFEAVFDAATDGKTFASALSILGGFQDGAGLASENLNCADPADITVLSGSKWVISTYNRQLAGGHHSGKATVVIGGDAEVGMLYYTSVNKPGVKCGDVEITVKDSATVSNILASPNANNGLDPISVNSLTVNWNGGNIDAVSLTDGMTSAKNTAVITNGSTLNYTAGEVEKDSFAAISALFDEINVTVKDGVKSLSKDALSDWESIREITLPAGMTTLGENVFGGCKALERLTVLSAVAELTDAAVPKSAVIIAPKGSPAEQYATENGNKFMPIGLELNSASLTLYNNLAVNYKVKKAEFDAEGYTEPYVKIVMNGETTVITEYTVSDNMYVFSFRNLAPYHMNDEMKATLYASFNGVEYESETVTYSIARYCYRQLAKTTNSKFRTLLVDLLNYGAETQKYVGYKTDELVNAALSAEQAAWGTAAAPEVADGLSFIGEATDTAIWKSASIYLKDEISVRIKFTTADVSGLYVKVEMLGKEYRIDKFDFDENGRYVARFEGFNATHLREEIKATVCDANGNAVSNTLVYSVETYTARNLNNENLCGVVKAMMNYGDAAVDYGKESGAIVDGETDEDYYGLNFETPITVTQYSTASSAGSAYARMYVLQDGRMICAWPSTNNGQRCMKAVFSEDDGLTWGETKILFYGEDPTKTLANVDIIQLESGRVLIAYRSNDKEASGGYSSIRIHASDDNCQSFYPHSIVCELQQDGLEDGVSWGLWEPDFCYVNGKLTCFFAVGKTVYEQPIIPSTDIFEWDETAEKWVRASYTSDDTRKSDRNGMPIADKLSAGGYLMSVETKRFYAETGSNLLPYLLYSADGAHWEGVTGCFFPGNTAWGGAPYWVELPDGRIVVAFQTEEDVVGSELDTNDDKSRKTKIVMTKKGVDISKARSSDWTESYDPFGITAGKFGNWPGMLIHNGYLYIYTSTNDPEGGQIKLVRAYVGEKTENEDLVDDGIIDGAGYFVKNGSLALAGATFGTIHGELAAMSEIDGDLDSIWYLDRQSDGTYLIRSAVCGYYLSVKQKSTNDGSEIALYTETANHAQRWRAVVTDNGYKLQCVETGGYLGDAVQVASEASAPVWTLELAVTPETELPRVLSLKGATGAPASCPEIIKYNGVYYNINMSGGMKIKSSKDLITWSNVTTVFDTKPAWIMEQLGDDSIWSPGYYMVGGKLRIYYASSTTGSRNSVIGLVDCETPTSGFVDKGMVIRSYKESPNTTPYNCIDPNIFEDDDGKVYLVWGSYAEGIYMQRIDPETGLLHETDTTQYRLADAPDFMEAPYLIKRGDYYYLFLAMGSLNKTADYYWAVGRSTSLTGPYYDKNDNPLLGSKNLAPLTEWKDGVVGTAHAQPFLDDDGQWYMVSEAWEYRTTEGVSPIKLHISTIVWNEAGWPVTALSSDLLNELAEK